MIAYNSNIYALLNNSKVLRFLGLATLKDKRGKAKKQALASMKLDNVIISSNS